MAEKTKEQPVVSVMPDQALVLEWETVKGTSHPDQIQHLKEVTKTVETRKDDWLYDLGFKQFPLEFSASLDYFLRFSRCFVRELFKTAELETLRQDAVIGVPPGLVGDFISACPLMAGSEYVNAGMLERLWKVFNAAYSRDIEKFEGPVSDYFRRKNPDLHPAGRVFFHLVENKNSDLPFAFMATYSAGMGTNGKPKHLPLKHAIETHDDDALLTLLSTVYKAAEQSRIVTDLIDSGELFHPLAWDGDEAFAFLKEIPDYEACGVLCRIPDWWKQTATPPRVTISLGDKQPAMAGLDAMLDCNVKVGLGHLELSRQEVETILEQTQGLAFIKNKWVAVDPEKLRQALKACDRIEDLAASGMSLGTAMRTRLSPEKMLGRDDDGQVDVSITNGTWLTSVLEKMTHPEQVDPVVPGKGFKAALRPYQSKGVDWLNFLASYGFGACLADDMGLGKTVQILAWLSTLPSSQKRPATLLVVPASLISNWESEINRFLPGLKVCVAHPGFTSSNSQPNKAKKNKEFKLTKTQLNRLDLVITSYTLVKKYDWLATYSWRCLILDEAQAIKNPGTQQTRAIKSLPAAHRVIMTGTPVENRLSDLWSLFDFLNPGLLGNKKEFSDFAKTLKDDPNGYARLRQMIFPYILRRLKTDKTVIKDLPDKVEMKIFADLSPKQVVLYKKSIKDLKRAIQTAEGIQRKGLVLSFLLRFKQLCNHPDQITGSGDFKASHSGKFMRLGSICETVYEKRERVLVFTQFKEMTEPLRAFLETIFHHPGLVLHGSVPVAKRKKLIQTFQENAYCPFMVLSLKAGGVGLNLTRANHVVHFDRWWNPAVENQATDRAFRIGQTKKVLVHKFVTRGTIEEKIDLMISEKQALADQVVTASAEGLITEMDDQDLLDLFRLSLPE
ncbi:DEAD/DEAH box helicase [uncultured Desulfobacter sp.]|uniref:DEAD/DEAH box helicase n=1 Tax=uncultured Desulfobacter sp. TaxID=240139 RepID=UPI0029F5058A|nr:DEAD/DEAH box helicase [uncultured Desulfobacter sp.]